MLALDSKLELVQVLGSIPALALVLGSKLAQVQGSIRVLELHSKLGLARRSYCRDDDDVDQLQQLVQTTPQLPTPPELESQTSWSILLKRGTIVGRTGQYTKARFVVNRASGDRWLSWSNFSGK